MPELTLDITRLVFHKLIKKQHTGIDRVCLEYVKHFKNHAHALVRLPGKWVEFSQDSSKNIFQELISPDANSNLYFLYEIMKAIPRNIVRRRPQHTRFLLHIGHDGLNKKKYASHLKNLKFKGIFFIHDLIPIYNPEYCRDSDFSRHKSRMTTVLKEGFGVILNSNDTLKTLKAFAFAENLTIPLNAVAPLAPASLPKPQSNSLLNKPYFIMLGTIEPRKNHYLMLQLWKQLVSELGSEAPTLVIVGRRGWENENVIDLLDRCESLKPFVLEHPTCSDADLATLLAHARALLFPSFVEGYGMPLPEALSMGTPVIASDLPVFLEIAGNIPDYVNPLDTKCWRELIMNYIQPNSEMRRAQCERIQKFKVPTWKEHFEQVEVLLEQLNAAK